MPTISVVTRSRALGRRRAVGGFHWGKGPAIPAEGTCKLCSVVIGNSGRRIVLSSEEDLALTSSTERETASIPLAQPGRPQRGVPEGSNKRAKACSTSASVGERFS